MLQPSVQANQPAEYTCRNRIALYKVGQLATLAFLITSSKEVRCRRSLIYEEDCESTKENHATRHCGRTGSRMATAGAQMTKLLVAKRIARFTGCFFCFMPFQYCAAWEKRAPGNYRQRDGFFCSYRNRFSATIGVLLVGEQKGLRRAARQLGFEGAIGPEFGPNSSEEFSRWLRFSHVVSDEVTTTNFVMCIAMALYDIL